MEGQKLKKGKRSCLGTRLFLPLDVCPPPLASRCKGFSLIEMVIALVIISFTVAMVTPSLFRSLSNMEQRTSINKLATTLRYARSQAVTGKRNYQVYLDLSTYSYWLIPVTSENVEEGNVEAPSTASTLDKQLKIEKVVLGPKEVITSGTASITFYPSGSSSGGEIILKDTHNALHTILVEPITGKVKLK